MTAAASSGAATGPMSSFDRVRNAVDSNGGVQHRGPHELMALCPVHADRHASLSVSWVNGHRGGMVLLHCHGCNASATEIAEGLGLTMVDLFDEPLPERDALTRVGRSTQQRSAGRRRPKGGRLPARIAVAAPSPEVEHSWDRVKVYPYVSADGTVVQEVIREECSSCDGARHKQFRQLFVSANGTRLKRKPEGFESVLYRLPTLLSALADRSPVWLLEGEKDVETAENLGQVATTNAQGGLNFPVACAELFEGAEVRVVLDRDGAGWKRGIELASLLGGVGAQVQLLLPATVTPKSDFTDHVEAGLWSDEDEWGGFTPVRPGEVAAHSFAADVVEKQTLVEVALAEAAARVDLADTQVESDEELVRAQRWALEAERRFEHLSELVDKVVQQAAEEGTEWAGEAVESATIAWNAARVAARAAHEIAGVAIPPLLQDPELEPTPVTEAGADEATTANGPSATSVVVLNGIRGTNFIAPVYRIIEGNLVEIVTRKDGDQQAKLVLDIDARIVEMEYLEVTDDGVDVDEPDLMGREAMAGQNEINPASPQELTAVIIGYTHPDSREFLRIRIPAKEYRDCAWVETLPGPPAYDSRPSGVAKLRDALKGAGGREIRRVVRYRSTGWRRDEQGKYFFVHAGGAIDANGGRVAPVLLTGPLRMYDLPAPSPDPQRIREAFLLHSASMLERTPTRVSAALLGHVFRSALGPNPWVLALIGSPGSYKTSIASLVMHHWGEKWDRRRPATSMSGNGDTLNALRIKLNAAKDALYWADDVAPTRDFGAAQKSLEEFARLVHNGEQRSRSTRDGLGVLDGTPPRASALITSEVMPRPGSGAQRMLVVPLQAAEIDLEELKRLDGADSRHGRALLMASFLQWLCPRLEEIREEAFAEGNTYGNQLRDSGESVRQADALGSLWAGWHAMSRFLVDIGALTEGEVAQTGDLVTLGLSDAATASTDPDLPMRTGGRVRELLVHALQTGLAFVEDVETGEAPEWPLASRLGWRRSSMGVSNDGAQRWREEARGIRLGYVVSNPRPCDGDPQLLLELTGLEQVLKAAGGTMTDGLQIDRGTASRALYDEGVLIAEERKGRMPRYTVQRMIKCENRRQRMVALRLDKLFGNDGPDNIDPESGWGGPTDPTPDDQPTDQPTSSHSVIPDLFEGWLSSPTSPGHGVASTDSSTEAKSLTSSITDKEPEMAIETDAEGFSADGFQISPTSTCALCHGDEAGWEIDGLVMHLPCWWQSTAASRAIAAGTTGNQEEITPAPELSPPVAPAPKDTETRTKVVKTTGKEKAAAFTAPAAVLDVDGVWLPDGSRHELATPIAHVGDVAELVTTLNLGTWTSDTWSVPGQIWITDAMAQKVGIDTSTLGKRNRNDRLKELSAESAFVTDALAQGWQLGGQPGDRLGTWTRVWRGEARGVWVALISGMSQDPKEMPVLGDSPTAATLARRLALLAGALRFPWAVSPASTGIDLMIAARPKEWKRIFAPSDSDFAKKFQIFEADIDWSRTLSDAEAKCRYVHAFDRGGSYAAGIAGLELPIGEPEHHPDGMVFDRKLPGYWLIEIPEAADWRYPNPLNPMGLSISEPKWVTTPTLERAAQLGYEPEILEAFVWRDHGRVLVPWYERIRDARTALDIEGDTDALLAREQNKVIYTHTIGMLNSDMHLAGRPGYSPERHHHIVAKSRANIMYRIAKIGEDSGVWPVAVTKDTVLYVSDERDPQLAWPGDQKQFGRGFGNYKPEGSALLSDHLQYLDGQGYRGKSELIAPNEWAASAEGSDS
ncbi:telomere-binding protein [Rhodococcus erythropolis]|uniref:telomere-binding protein n=1 Tax=Rhodococcus erythropolis TaxID=1833 RepID=UPI001C9A8750|nr:telomere-binding protein [Rhodococcus erythropolis]MBY6388729.1 telomere-binding protein [Rhodococcus erythropolis]